MVYERFKAVFPYVFTSFFYDYLVQLYDHINSLRRFTETYEGLRNLTNISKRCFYRLTAPYDHKNCLRRLAKAYERLEAVSLCLYSLFFFDCVQINATIEIQAGLRRFCEGLRNFTNIFRPMFIYNLLLLRARLLLPYAERN